MVIGLHDVCMGVFLEKKVCARSRDLLHCKDTQRFLQNAHSHLLEWRPLCALAVHRYWNMYYARGLAVVKGNHTSSQPTRQKWFHFTYTHTHTPYILLDLSNVVQGSSSWFVWWHGSKSKKCYTLKKHRVVGLLCNCVIVVNATNKWNWNFLLIEFALFLLTSNRVSAFKNILHNRYQTDMNNSKNS